MPGFWHTTLTFVIFAVFVVVATCLVISITMGKKPDFDDPLLGFEPRGTEIGQRQVAYENLVKNIDGSLMLTPYGFQYEEAVIEKVRKREKSHSRQVKGRKTRSIEHSNFNQPESFFCGDPAKQYARVVYSSVTTESLYSLDHIHAMCQHEVTLIRSHHLFSENCIRYSQSYDTDCCRSWSLGNYIAQLANKTDCFSVNKDDIVYTYKLLKECSVYYYNYTLKSNCASSGTSNSHSYMHSRSDSTSCKNIPDICTQYNAVYNIMHYIVDSAFLKFEDSVKLEYVITFLPIAGSTGSLPLFKHLEKQKRMFGNVKVVAAKFDVKHTLFNEYLISDTLWLAMAASVIFISFWIYSSSIFITFMTFLAMFWSLEVSYFVYGLVFEINFFPYMNIITVIIMIAIGADDVCVYCKVWQNSKSERNNGNLEKIVSNTLKHATLSMFVTSFTTAAALYSNFISQITAIKCFSIYAGTVICCNFILMITWIPATVIVYEKWLNCCMCYSPEFYSRESLTYYFRKIPHKIYHNASNISRIFFEKILPYLIIKLKYMWVFLFTACGICSILVIFYDPKLRLPSSGLFQVFSMEHLIESYDFNYGKKFSFEKTLKNEKPFLPLTIVWGVKPIDNGDNMDPMEKGLLQFDHTFDLSDPEAQIWLLLFCRNLRNAGFYQRIPGIELTNCYLENFRHFMRRSCKTDEFNYFPCCRKSKFPFKKNVFIQCLGIYTTLLIKTPGVHYNYHSPGPRFTDRKISAFIVEFWSNYTLSFSYSEMSEFYEKVNNWITKEMRTAPKSMKHGWFVSDLHFFDLQKTLATGTPFAMGISLVVTILVTFFTTLNILVTVYAIMCIACIMFITVGTIVLLGWELNVLEAVIITVAIGMSIDHTLHYGVAYRLAPDMDRELRVANAISNVGSAISMATVTTFLPGVLMLPSIILVYQKFGIFLMLIIGIGWVFSTFYFMALLAVAGPQGGFGQFRYPTSGCFMSGSKKHIDKTVYTFSESTLSSSSTGNHTYTTSSGIHELEPLTETAEEESQNIEQHANLQTLIDPSCDRTPISTGCDTFEEEQIGVSNSGDTLKPKSVYLPADRRHKTNGHHVHVTFEDDPPHLSSAS